MVTAIFDGRCVICQMTRRIITTLDWRRRVTFLDLHDAEAIRRRYPQLSDADLMGEIHVIDGDGRVFAGFRGTHRLLRSVPVGWPIWALLHLPGMMWLGNRLYRWIARHRYAVNRLLGVDLAPCEDGVCKV